tara:strand:+ start:19443 stop:20138 length:696 start_codon:yes stop_codon:yes gene_type:complete
MKYLLLIIFTFTDICSASSYDHLIDAAAQRHGLDRFVLRALINVETQGNPWSFNCDGEGFSFDSKQEALISLFQLSQNPWMVKVSTRSHQKIRHFFPNRNFAETYLNELVNNSSDPAIANIRILSDDEKAVHEGQARIRKLWMINTDIGIAQINYRYFGENRPVQHWFDPAFNIDFAASLLAQHKQVTGDDIEAAGRYHSKTPSLRDLYLEKLIPAYNREIANENSQIASF